MTTRIKHSGAYRSQTGAPAGEDIPASRVEHDLKSYNAKTRKRAQLAKNARTWTRGRHLTASRDAPEHTLVVRYDDEDDTLRKLIRELNRLGREGSSRSIEVDDFRVGWDGDGTDRIWSAEVDGEDALDQQAEAAALEVASKFWDALTPRERRAYLKAHPHSKYANRTALPAKSAPAAKSALAQYLKQRGWVRHPDHWAHPESRRKMVISRGDTHRHRIAVTHSNGDVAIKHTDSDRMLRKFARRMAERPKSNISAVLKSRAGSLHEHLGVPHGSPIPLGKLARLAESDHPLAGRARLVLNLKRARARGLIDYEPAK